MTYIDRVLGEDESILHRGKIHWVVYVRPVIMAIIGMPFILATPFTQGADGTKAFLVIGIMILLVAALNWLIAWIERITTEIAVTSRRFIIKYGLIWRSTSEMSAKRIESVEVDQSVIGRILNFGTVTARGTGTGLEPIRRVDSPLKLRNAIGQLQDRNGA
jgi:uncharacterized membrane protein YdbT with pleckstrin-like domain